MNACLCNEKEKEETSFLFEDEAEADLSSSVSVAHLVSKQWKLTRRHSHTDTVT